ncbi:MAG: methyltransferase domain-containing protein [Aphanocapsa sp. GSE-SYN-MK-11-07L]|jgi:ubiquinone/menaquinone biosynthesis C-methylase UbiE|nr:methyltransferase domain-containing protein [Aphanocapsa sp. GSE-SYN-MK-11-07L]
MSSDPVKQEYARLAGQYDSRWSFYVQATTQATLSRLNLHPGDRILDLGCGTGTLIQTLLQIAPEVQVVGLDPVAEMLNLARQKLPTAVELKLGSATDLPFANHSFDVLVSTSAFHYIRDPEQAIQEMQRVLKPGGRLVMTDWCYDYWTCQLLDFWLRLFNRAHFRTYRAAQVQTLLQAAGFERVVVERYKINWLWGMMTAQALTAK